MPTMPAVFSVPLRRPDSCPPPEQQRLETQAAPHIERAHALGAMELVCR